MGFSGRATDGGVVENGSVSVSPTISGSRGSSKRAFHFCQSEVALGDIMDSGGTLSTPAAIANLRAPLETSVLTSKEENEIYHSVMNAGHRHGQNAT